jgi:hypothetical protein
MFCCSVCGGVGHNKNNTKFHSDSNYTSWQWEVRSYSIDEDENNISYFPIRDLEDAAKYFKITVNTCLYSKHNNITLVRLMKTSSVWNEDAKILETMSEVIFDEWKKE